MRIKLRELRQVVRKVLSEAMPEDKATISADLDPGEMNLKDKHPHWGSSSKARIGVDSPANVKSKQVAKILAAQGVTADAMNKKIVVHDLLPYIEKMNPQEMFATDPEEIAAEFASNVLGIHSN